MNAAHARGVKVVPTVTFMSWNGDYSALTTLLTSPANRARLVGEIIGIIRGRGADGVNVDFEPVPSSLRTQFTTFIRELKAGLRERRRRLVPHRRDDGRCRGLGHRLRRRRADRCRCCRRADGDGLRLPLVRLGAGRRRRADRERHDLRLRRCDARSPGARAGRQADLGHPLLRAGLEHDHPGAERTGARPGPVGRLQLLLDR